MRKLSILFILMGTLTVAYAQDGYNNNYYGDEPARFDLGLKVHPVFGWIKPSSDGISSEGSITGFSYGLMADFYLSDRYAFSTGLEITSTGGKTSHLDADNNTVLSDYKLQYIEIPLTVRLKTNPTGPAVFYGQFGIVPGVNIKARADRTTINANDPTIKTDEPKLDVADEITPFRAGLAIGAGVIYDVGGNTRLLGGITFNNGFTDVFSGDAKATASYIALNLGVFF